MFRFNKTIIREPTLCASLKLQYWRQLKYFVIEQFGLVAAYAATRPNCSITKYFILTDANIVTLAKHTP